MKKKRPILVFILLISLSLVHVGKLTGQENKYKLATVGFYNLENLFDTIDQKGVRDSEYTPESEKNWDTEKYQNKLRNMAQIISRIGRELSPLPPTILGVSEIENRGVLEDLVQTPKLKPHNYGIVHYNSPDERGIDVALLYQKEYFTVTNTKSVRFPRIKDEEGDTFLTRDQLVVSGMLDNEKIHIVVNHWPSRYGGEKRSRPYRNEAARLCRAIVDSLMTLEKDPKIIVMGDFNDDPINESLTKYLKAEGKKKKVDGKELYNPMYEMHKKGLGTLAYRDQWNLFDQVIVSKALIREELDSYRLYQTNIFAKEYMKQEEGRYKGYPKRTHAGGIYLNGYSDHFPVYIYLIKKINN